MSVEIERLIHRLSMDMINNPISFRRLAKAIGISVKPLKSLLAGENKARLETVLKIEKYLIRDHKEE